MASNSHEMNGTGGAAGAGGRHAPDMGPMYADAGSSAANLKARGAADRMWQKVEEDLERIDLAENEEAEDE